MKLAELTEEEASGITPSTVLNELNAWDSLAKVSFLIFASTEFGVQLEGSDVQKAKTVEDLHGLIISAQTNAS